jgi:2-amino-4-hydroxy-6-hydroxymethyldihydropteridine diphosphokinase
MKDNCQATTAFLALGSNLGDRLAALKGARRALNSVPEIQVLAASAIYETEPVGGPAEQPPYLNAVLKIQTSLTAHDLLAVGLAVEQQFGRRRQERWGARSLDVDLLFYGSEILQFEDLVIPHPRLHQRAFVLVPLMDIAPDLGHPLLRETVAEMLAQLPSTAGIERLSGHW